VEAGPNARWSLDFVYDQFANGRRFRVLNIVDDITKECLGAIPDTSMWRESWQRRSHGAASARLSPVTAPSSPAMPCWPSKEAGID
jgi:hypothetical protein